MKYIVKALIIIVLFSCQKKYEKGYYDDGSLMFKVNLKNGLRNGKYYEYYPDGKLRSEFYYKDGLKTGLLKGYFPNGKLKVIYNYSNDKMHGPFKAFYQSGKIKVEGYYKNDDPDSVGYEYYKNGQLEKYYYYNKGELVYYKAFSEDGLYYDNKLPIRIVPNDTFDCYSVNDTHKIKIELLHTINPDKTRFGIIIGNLNENNRLIDTLDVVGSKNLIAYYQEKPSHTGNNTISGVLFELDKEDDNRIIGQFHFLYNYCVE